MNSTITLLADEAKAATMDFSALTEPIVTMINSLFAPMMAIVVALGTLYCVVLGVKYAKAEEPQEREKAKNSLKNAIIGFVMIFVLMLGLKILEPQFTKWVDSQASAAVVDDKE